MWIYLLELITRFDFGLFDFKACYTSCGKRLGQSLRHQATGKTLDELISKPAVKYKMQGNDQGWMDAPIHVGAWTQVSRVFPAQKHNL